MQQDTGASADADRAGHPSDGAPAGLRDTVTIPSATHTPGPWHEYASNYAAEHHNSVEINDPNGLTVAWAQKFVPPYTPQSEANAQLIAAAPELYEALEIAAALIGGPTSFAGLASDDEVEHTVRVRIDDILRFRAVLAKARGAA